MKKILLTLIIGIGVAGIANATLWDFYNGNLPSVSDRASEATECDISDYTGTYDQNIKLENCLREKSFLGATTSTAPTPAPSLYRNQTWTGVNTYTSSTISSGNNTWTGTNTFNGTTTVTDFTINSIPFTTLLNASSSAVSAVFSTTSIPVGDSYYYVTTTTAFTPETIIVYYDLAGTDGSGATYGCYGQTTYRGTTAVSGQYLNNGINPGDITWSTIGMGAITSCGAGGGNTSVAFEISSITSNSFTIKYTLHGGTTYNTIAATAYAVAFK